VWMEFHAFFCICSSLASMDFLPNLHYIQSCGWNSQCRACCLWESIRRRSYSRVRVSCIDSIVDRDPIVVFGSSFSFSVSFHVCIGGVFLSIFGWWALYRSDYSQRLLFSLGTYWFFFEGSRLWFIKVISELLLDVNIDEGSGLMEFIVFWVSRTFVGYLSEWIETVLEVLDSPRPTSIKLFTGCTVQGVARPSCGSMFSKHLSWGIGKVGLFWIAASL